MQGPILKKFTTEPGKGPGQSLGDLILELDYAGLLAVVQDIERQMRYGKIANAPFSVDFSDVGFTGVSELFRVVVVTAVCPLTEKKDIPECVREAIIEVFKQKQKRK